MGLLDDAIREHLELKRLSGADPGVVAREEQDALGRVPRRGEEGNDAQENSETGAASEADGSFFPGSESAPVADHSAGQETVEINMEAELEAGADSGTEPTTPAVHPTRGQTNAEDSLEWEVPSDRPKETGDGGARDPREEHSLETGEEHVEDVLEETPDFLRDTPEQERLWFEQRPPRDFDFNE